MTERLYYTDAYLTQFRSTVIAARDRRVVLDRTAFYPTSGGQPFDTGSIGNLEVVDVVDEGDDIVHVVEGTEMPEVGTTVECQIRWTRRFDHMQQHTGQHLLSALLADHFGAPTTSVHFGADYSTVDVSGTPLDAAAIERLEFMANEIIVGNRDVSVSFEDAESATGLRKPSERDGLLRIVTIDGIDRSACGGTHVRRTGEIGAMLLRRTERMKGQQRIEFLCGSRVVRAARTDYLTLQEASRLMSAAPAEVPALVQAQLERVRDLERDLRRVDGELAVFRARELWNAAAMSRGVRIIQIERGEGEARDEQQLASAIASLGGAIAIVTARATRSVLLAISDDVGADAGKLLKPLLAEFGGRGGGSPKVAQGVVADANMLSQLTQKVVQAAVPSA